MKTMYASKAVADVVTLLTAWAVVGYCITIIMSNLTINSPLTHLLRIFLFPIGVIEICRSMAGVSIIIVMVSFALSAVASFALAGAIKNAEKAC